MLADGVDLPDLRPAPQERFIQGLQVLEGDAGRRIREERRRPAGDEDQEEIVVPKSFQKFFCLLCRLDAPFVGLRVPGGDGLEGGRWLLVAALDYAQAAVQGISQDFSSGPGHRSRGFTHRQHEDAARLEDFVPDHYTPVF